MPNIHWVLVQGYLPAMRLKVCKKIQSLEGYE